MLGHGEVEKQQSRDLAEGSASKRALLARVALALGGLAPARATAAEQVGEEITKALVVRDMYPV